jgi:hypothetical protein
MPILVEWLVPHKVIFERSWGDVTPDAAEFDRLVIEHIDSSSAPLVHMIGDVREMTATPKFGGLKMMRFLQHPRLGWYIFVGVENRIIKMFGTAVLQIFRVRHRFVSSTAEALAFLQKVDSTLPDLQVAWTDYQAQHNA